MTISGKDIALLVLAAGAVAGVGVWNHNDAKNYRNLPKCTFPERVYTIQPGDTLTRIAKEHGTPLSELLRFNPHYKDNPDHIKPGQDLCLPIKPTSNRRYNQQYNSQERYTARFNSTRR